MIITRDNRYLVSHCENGLLANQDFGVYCDGPHYGDMSLVRDTCIMVTLEANERAWRVALTNGHPAAYILSRYLDVHLTDAERAIADTMVGERGWWRPS